MITFQPPDISHGGLHDSTLHSARAQSLDGLFNLPADELLGLCTQMSLAGARKFREQQHSHAAHLYSTVLLVREAEGFDAEALSKLRIAARRNLATVRLSQDQPVEAARVCTEALAEDSTDAKAMYQLGIAYTRMGLPAQSVAWLEQALALRDDCGIRNALHDARLRLRAYKSNPISERAQLANACGGESAAAPYLAGARELAESGHTARLEKLNIVSPTFAAAFPTLRGKERSDAIAQLEARTLAAVVTQTLEHPGADLESPLRPVEDMRDASLGETSLHYRAGVLTQELKQLGSVVVNSGLQLHMVNREIKLLLARSERQPSGGAAVEAAATVECCPQRPLAGVIAPGSRIRSLVTAPGVDELYPGCCAAGYRVQGIVNEIAQGGPGLGPLTAPDVFQLCRYTGRHILHQDGMLGSRHHAPRALSALLVTSPDLWMGDAVARWTLRYFPKGGEPREIPLEAGKVVIFQSSGRWEIAPPTQDWRQPLNVLGLSVFSGEADPTVAHAIQYALAPPVVSDEEVKRTGGDDWLITRKCGVSAVGTELPVPTAVHTHKVRARQNSEETTWLPRTSGGSDAPSGGGYESGEVEAKIYHYAMPVEDALKSRALPSGDIATDAPIVCAVPRTATTRSPSAMYDLTYSRFKGIEYDTSDDDVEVPMIPPTPDRLRQLELEKERKEALAALKAKNARATNSGCIDLGKMKGEQLAREQAIAASVDRARDLRERRLEAMRIERDGK